MDEKSRKANWRLDTREGALSIAKSGEKAVVPGHSETSELVRRLYTEDSDQKMPPSSTKVRLPKSAAEVLELGCAQALPTRRSGLLPPHQSSLPFA